MVGFFFNCFVGWCILFLIPFLVSGKVKENVEENQKESLYAKSDPILQLNINTFNSSVYNKSKAFFIEFYSSWCGHCINFAPSWQQLSIDVKYWQPVVEIGAVNCALDSNMPLCRQHNVYSYPTISYFKYMARNQDDSYDFLDIRENVGHLRKGLAKFVVADYIKNKPSHWPNFTAIDNNADIQTLFTANADIQYVSVIFDVSESLVGQEVILDLNWAHNEGVIIRTAYNIHRQYSSLRLSHTPALVIYKRGSNEPVYKSTSAVTRQDIATKIRYKTNLAIKELTNVQETTSVDDISNANRAVASGDVVPHTSSLQVYNTDLQSTLNYILQHEVAQQNTLKPVQLNALKNFLDLLIKYLPHQSSNLKSLLKSLQNWISFEGEHELRGEDWSAKIIEFQTSNDNPLETETSWVGCRGSTPAYRGYPCGLWTLFHTLTVNAFLKDGKHSTFNSSQVLYTIRDYVLQFFGCKACANNFEKEAQNIKESAKEPKDVVLWLWEVHNKVNERLKGDKTEDPLHLKRAFPSEQLCSKCRTVRGFWQREAVLDTLVSYYSNIATGPLHQDLRADLFTKSKLKALERSFLFGNSDDQFRGSGTIRQAWGSWLNLSSWDVSICFVLWISSILLLACCYILFRHGRLKFSFINKHKFF